MTTVYQLPKPVAVRRWGDLRDGSMLWLSHLLLIPIF